MMKQIRMTAIALLGAIGITFAAPTAAHASKQGKRNTALALGAVAAYGLIKKKPLIAGLAGAGAVYSWIQSNKDDDNDRDRRRRRNRRYYRNNGYYNGYAPAYQPAPVYQQPYYGGSRYSGYRGRPHYSSYGGYRSYNAGRSYRGRGHAYGRQRRCD